MKDGKRSILIEFDKVTAGSVPEYVVALQAVSPDLWACQEVDRMKPMCWTVHDGRPMSAGWVIGLNALNTETGIKDGLGVGFARTSTVSTAKAEVAMLAQDLFNDNGIRWPFVDGRELQPTVRDSVAVWVAPNGGDLYCTVGGLAAAFEARPAPRSG